MTCTTTNIAAEVPGAKPEQDLTYEHLEFRILQQAFALISKWKASKYIIPRRKTRVPDFKEVEFLRFIFF